METFAQTAARLGIKAGVPVASPAQETFAQTAIRLGIQATTPQTTQEKLSQGLVENLPGTAKTLAELQVDPLSLKANPLKTISDAWHAISGSVINAGESIKELFAPNKTAAERVGAGLETVARGAGVVLSPISALFSAAKDIPVLGSVARLIELPFSVAGEAGGHAGNVVIDGLRSTGVIDQATADKLKPGVSEIFSLAAQLALGKAGDVVLKNTLPSEKSATSFRENYLKINPDHAEVAKIGTNKINDLVKTYGEQDAQTIIKKSIDLAREKAGIEAPKTEVPPTEAPKEPVIAPESPVKGVPLEPVESITSRINSDTTKIYDRTPKPIANLIPDVAKIVGDNVVHISDFVVAKIKGLVKGLSGHPKITDEILHRIPESLSNPKEILQDTRTGKKYLFISLDPLHNIVVEIARRESGKTEINTIYELDKAELKRLENKFPTVYSSGGTPSPSYMPLSSESAGRRFSGPQNDSIVAKEQTPVKGTQVTKAASDINQSLVSKGFNELTPDEQAKFNPITKGEQTKKVAELMTNDLEQAKRMATGKEEIPSDVNSQVLFNAVKNKALADLDASTLRDLALSPLAEERSLAAQTLGAAGFENGMHGTDPVKAIREVVKEKEAKLVREGKDIAKTKKAETQKIKAEITKLKPTKETFESFINSLQC